MCDNAEGLCTFFQILFEMLSAQNYVLFQDIVCINSGFLVSSPVFPEFPNILIWS